MVCSFIILYNTIENTPPVILADSVFRVNLGEESIYSLSVSDPDGDNFTLTLMNDLPDDPKLEQTEEEYLFVWTLLEITNVTLTFVATDSKGAATIFSPTVELCACVNNGNCTRDGLLVNSPTIVMNCRCSEGMLQGFAHIFPFQTEKHKVRTVDRELQLLVVNLLSH